MAFEQIISDIITEVSYRSKDGIVDFKNPNHISILSEVLDDMGLWEIKSELFQNLFEADAKNPDDEKYKNTGGSGYVKAADYERWRNNPDGFDGLRFRKTDSGDYVQVDKDGNEVEKDVDTSQDGFWDYLKGDKSETNGESEDEIEDGVDRAGFDTKGKAQRDAPNGPNAQQILDDLNEGNLDKLIEYQNEVEKIEQQVLLVLVER